MKRNDGFLDYVKFEECKNERSIEKSFKRTLKKVYNLECGTLFDLKTGDLMIQIDGRVYVMDEGSLDRLLKEFLDYLKRNHNI